MNVFVRLLALVALLGLALWGIRPAAAQSGAQTPTFSRDIAPILYQNCVSCHHNGEVAPFPLVTYADAKKRASLIAAVTGQQVMPPWKPAAGHGEFRRARRLGAQQIQILKRWADAGAPAGDPAQLPPAPQFTDGWKLGKPDLIVKLDRPFAIPAEGDDIYQHFVFSLGLPKDRYLRAIDVHPGNRKVVHHAIGLLDASGTARKLDAQTPEIGYRGMGGSGFVPAGFTPGYVPGQTPEFLPADGALTLPKGADFVLQIHYHPSGKPEVDQTEVGLYFTDQKPTRNGNIVLMGSSDIDIAPNNASYTVTDEVTLPVAVNLGSIWAHLHFLGKDVRVWAELPDGSTHRLLWIDNWDFNWQESYVYAAPIRLPAHTVLRARFVFDNSAQNPRNPSRPPRRVLIGENSTDEMAGLVLGVETDNGIENLALFASTVGHYFEMEKKGERARAEAQKAHPQKADQRTKDRDNTAGMWLFRRGMSGGGPALAASLTNPLSTWIVAVLSAAVFFATVAVALPAPSRAAERTLRAAPMLCLGVGLLTAIIASPLALALLFAVGDAAQGLGVLLSLSLAACAIVGAGAWARRCALTPSSEQGGWRRAVWAVGLGALLVAAVSALPLLGWLLIAPLALITGIGATVTATVSAIRRSAVRFPGRHRVMRPGQANPAVST